MLYVRIGGKERRVTVPGGRLAAVPGFAAALKDALQALRREAGQDADRAALLEATRTGDAKEIKRLTRKVVYAANSKRVSSDDPVSP